MHDATNMTMFRSHFSAFLSLLLLLVVTGAPEAPSAAESWPAGFRSTSAPREESVRQDLEVTDERIAAARQAAGATAGKTVDDLLRNATAQQSEARRFLAAGRVGRARTATRVASRLAGRALEILGAHSPGRDDLATSLNRAEARLREAQEWAALRPRGGGVNGRLQRIRRGIDGAWGAYRRGRSELALRQLASVRLIFGELEALGFRIRSGASAGNESGDPTGASKAASLLELTQAFLRQVERRVGAEAAVDLERSRRYLIEAQGGAGSPESLRVTLIRAGLAAVSAGERGRSDPDTELVAALMALTASLLRSAEPAAQGASMADRSRSAIDGELREASSLLAGGRPREAWIHAVSAARGLAALEGVTP